MTTYQNTLKEMIGDVDDTVAGLDNSISQIEDQEDELQEQIDAIKNALTDACQTYLVDRLENVKLPYFQGIDPNAYLEYDPGFGSLGYGNNLTGWRIKAPAPSSSVSISTPEDITLYEFEGSGWDSDENIEKWVSDWDFGNDYLTRPLTTGASYGLIPYKSNLGTARALLLENRDKISDSKDIFGDYI